MKGLCLESFGPAFPKLRSASVLLLTVGPIQVGFRATPVSQPEVHEFGSKQRVCLSASTKVHCFAPQCDQYLVPQHRTNDCIVQKEVKRGVTQGVDEINTGPL